MALSSWTNQQIIEQLAAGDHWPGPVITYALPQAASQLPPDSKEESSFLPINAVQLPLVELAFSLWDELIAPDIVLGPIEQADILVGNFSRENIFAYAYLPPGGYIWFSANHQTLSAPQIGEYGFSVFIHEAGHALGLSHMGNYNGASANIPSSFQDSTVFSIMSYFGPGVERTESGSAWAQWIGADGERYSSQTPMRSDIMAIQDMYGANPHTRVDNTTYGFNSNIQGPTALVYDFSLNANPILTIYDAGGNDTLDLSGWDTDSFVSLGPGQYSSANGMTDNISIAWNTLIENAVTGAGNDIFQGNYADNHLDGGAGFDTVIYMGRFENYQLSYNPLNREYTVHDRTGKDGRDTLINIEYAAFHDLEAELSELTEAVYRFYSPQRDAHFLTSSNDEASAVIENADFIFEGVAFGRQIHNDGVPVHRFLNGETGDHLYTVDEAEISHLQEAAGPWQYEGLAFNAYAGPQEGVTGLYRFVNKSSASHFYTADAGEMDAILLSGYFDYEGLAFYVAV